MERLEDFQKRYQGLRFAIGECLNASSFELALALVQYGYEVKEIYGTVSAEQFAYIKLLAQLSPETKIYTNLSPTMLFYDCSQAQVDVTIGKDAAYYHPDSVNVPWNQERQPFGYAGLTLLLDEIDQALAGEEAIR